MAVRSMDTKHFIVNEELTHSTHRMYRHRPWFDYKFISYFTPTLKWY